MASRNKNKKALQPDLDAELDHTESVEKILELLPRNSETAFKFYCQILGRRCQSVAGDHSNVLSHNLTPYDIQNLECHYKSWAYHKMLPYMINPSVKHLESTDPMTDLLVKKSEWRARYMTMAKWAAPLASEYKRVNADVAVAPVFLVKITEHLKKDPDPDFDCEFNWYYAGRGNITKATVSGRDLILYSVKNILYVADLIADMNGYNIDFEQASQFTCVNNILETLCFNNLVALRCYNKIYLILLNASEKITFDVRKIFETESKYTSVEIDGTALYATHLDDKIDIISFENGTHQYINTDIKNTKSNRWSCVRKFDDNNLLYACKSCVKLLDTRTQQFVLSLESLKNVTDPCSFISCISVSRKCEYVYVGTNHNLLLADLKYINEKSCNKPRYLNRWSHGMKSPPIFIDLLDFEVDQELICLNSQWVEDPTITVNGFAEFSMIPYKPKNIFNTYNEARIHNYCIDPILPLNERLVKSLTGCLLLENGEHFELFLQNSLGDVSKQVFAPHHSLKPQYDAVSLLNEWSKQLYRSNKPMVCTEVEDISKFWRNCERVSSDVESYKPSNTGKSNYDERKIIDFNNMDNFAEGLLTAWGINEVTKKEN